MTTTAEIFGFPGEQHTFMIRPGYPDPVDPRNVGGPEGLPGLYKVTFVLARPGFALVGERESKPATEIEGDSHLAILKPAFVPPDNPEANQIKMYGKTGDGVFEFTGAANTKGFLGKIECEPFHAESHEDARRKAFRALAPSLSNWSVHLDIPLTIYQWETRELRTSSGSRGLLMPHMEVPFAVQSAVGLKPEFRSYASLYREALNSDSPVYRFLCLFKMTEGILARRRRLGEEARKMGARLTRPEERIPADPRQFLPWLNAIFPVRRQWDEMTLRSIFINEAVGQRIKHLVDGHLHRLRTNVAHALSTPSGELTLSADESLHIEEVNKWLPITRCIVRHMLKNEFPDDFLSYLQEDKSISSAARAE